MANSIALFKKYIDLLDEVYKSGSKTSVLDIDAKSVTLEGEETQVHFTSAFPYFWVRNDSGGTVLMSISPNIEEGGDGVIEVLAGSSAGTMHGYNATSTDLYLLGSGKVQVMGTYTPENPFKLAGKGGGSGGVNKVSQCLYGFGVITDVMVGTLWEE